MLLTPIVQMGVSFIVIRYHSEALWGNTVEELIYYSLFLHLANWGHKDYLLRRFSEEPAKVAKLWQENLSTRFLFLLIPICYYLFWGYSWELFAWLMLWIGLAYLCRSSEVIYLYEKQFWLPIAAEAVSAFIVIIPLFFYDVTVLFLIQLYTVGHILKFLMLIPYSLYQIGGISPSVLRFSFTHIKEAWPFFILGLTAMLQSKTDLYMVSALLGDAELGRYQVLSNIFLYVQALAGLSLHPFVKNIYRLPDRSIYKLSNKMLVYGAALTTCAIPASYLVLQWVYAFDFSIWMYIWAVVFLLPIYYYSPIVYLLFKHKKETWVIWTNIFGIGVNIIFNALLIEPFGNLGAFIGSSLAQVCILLAYHQQRNRIAQKQ